MAGKFDLKKSPSGKYMFNLKAGNNQEIARSVEFDSTDAMEAAISDCMVKIPAIAAGDGEKKEAAAGPSLEQIPPDEMLEHIESIREIMEFSDKEKEIRTMCEQSSIPKCLVDIAVSEPDRLDTLEKEAEG